MLEIINKMTADKTTFSSIEQGSATLTPQQSRFRSSKNPFTVYKELSAGAEASWLSFFLFEIYTLLFSALPGLLGYGSRALLLPLLLKRCGKGLRVGRSVTFRQVGAISMGDGVLIDDYAVLDIRQNPTEQSSAQISIADNVFIGRESILAAKGAAIELHSGCNISSHCRIATESGISIGESTLIAAYAYIGPGNHQRDAEGNLLVDGEMEKQGGVRIGKRCWIGARATILDGVSIGDGAIVGAHALVKDDVPAGATVVGIPAKVVS